MSWIKMRCDLRNDPAVLVLSELTGIDVHGVVGRLHMIWSWADSVSRDGHVRSVTPTALVLFIDREVGFGGFAKAMAEVGWLRIGSDRVTFPNFDRHMSKSAKNRALASERQSRKRRDAMSRTERDDSVTREEKSREEKSSTKTASGRRGSRLPDDAVLTDEWRKVAADEGVPASEVETLFREFVGYWTALPGQKATKLDWLATWRNRCIAKAPSYRRSPSPQPDPSRRNSFVPEPARQNIPTADETRARIRAEDEERRRQELRAQLRSVS